MGSTDDDRDSHAKRLERMQNDFRAAQQRRRNRAPTAAVRHEQLGDGPHLTPHAADRPHDIATLRSETVRQLNLRSPLGRLTVRLPDGCHREDVPVSVPVAPLDEAQPPVPAAYMPLYTYLDRRCAATVVLTFEQIEALLGFTPPPPAFADAEWWTHSQEATDRHCAAWTAARRSAAPQLRARLVAFERLP